MPYVSECCVIFSVSYLTSKALLCFLINFYIFIDFLSRKILYNRIKSIFTEKHFYITWLEKDIIVKNWLAQYF